MGFHSLHACLHVSFTLFFVFHKTGLQKTVFSFNAIILRQILAKIDNLQLVASGQSARLHVATFESGLGRKRHPIQIRWQGPSAVGLDGDALARLLFQLRHKSLVNEQGRLAARQHDQRSQGIFINLVHNLLQRHHLSCLMLGVTKSAAQVAATETHKDSRRTCVEAFALKRVEYFVDLVHGLRDTGLRALRQAQGPRGR